jgi:hypothetical protein
MAFMTGSSSSSYSGGSRLTTVGCGSMGAVFVGGEGGGVNDPSTWTCRFTRFGLRGFTSGC